MAAGVTDKLMSFEGIVALVDAREAERRPAKQGSYKRRGTTAISN